MSHRVGGVVWTVVTATLLGVPAGLLVGLLLSHEQLDGLSQTPGAIVEPARITEFDERTGVAATLTWTEGPTLYAPAWSGTVGNVHLRPGDALRTGDPIAVIDGVTRLTVAGPQPFYRSLALDARGPDVTWLHRALTALGYLEKVPDDESHVSRTTIAAVRALAADLGSSGPVEAFDPGWFVWLPEGPFEVASVQLTAGAQAPSHGANVAAGAPRLDSVALLRLDGGPLKPEPGVAYVLAIDGEELPLDPETGAVRQEDLGRLSAALTPLLDSASGSVRRAESLAVWSLPSSAIMSGSNGRLCIWADSGGRYEAVAVEVVSGRAGVTFIRPAATSARVLYNPADILAEPACPSA